MKKLLVTTAMCLVLGTGVNVFAGTNELLLTMSYDTNQFTQVLSQQKILAPAANMYRGDFQQIAGSELSINLYAGDSSFKMGSIRMLRY